MKTLLFDLGGVVVDYRGPERLAALTKGAMSLDEAREALSTSANLHAFERGEIAPALFAHNAIAEWRLEVTPDFFIADFETWPERFLPDAPDIIRSLNDRFRLACLSNINIPHWRQAKALGLPPLFEQAFLSHEMSARKPEPEIYQRVISSLGVDADDICFFDDSRSNVDAALEHDLKAFHVTPEGGIEQALKDAGVL